MLEQVFANHLRVASIWTKAVRQFLRKSLSDKNKKPLSVNTTQFGELLLYSGELSKGEHRQPERSINKK